LEAREKEKLMMKDEETLEPLRQAGWTTSEIEQLCRFRRVYLQQKPWTRRNERRPAFVRWLLRILQEGFPLPVQDDHAEAVQQDSAVWDWPNCW
jgi:hypothetical protein